ncbi:MAG: hypothetical protein SYC29_06050 [Planctomycetota bacterium]|nr:hypothetical protein [Planctomycetota bacterium]
MPGLLLRRRCAGGGRLWWVALPVLLACLAGCSSPEAREVLRLEAGHYGRAFEAAVEVARDAGLPAILRDRRGGIIETEPQIAPSLLEPWRLDGATLTTRLENTLALQRRRMRFEFTPAGFRAGAAGPGEALEGPDLLALDGRPVDLTRLDEPLELRVRVYLERAHEPGLRHHTWSRRLTTSTKILLGGEAPRALDKTFWTPVARDRGFEQRMLAAIEKRLSAPALASP